jgi:hypothetical protein
MYVLRHTHTQPASSHAAPASHYEVADNVNRGRQALPQFIQPLPGHATGRRYSSGCLRSIPAPGRQARRQPDRWQGCPAKVHISVHGAVAGKAARPPRRAAARTTGSSCGTMAILQPPARGWATIAQVARLLPPRTGAAQLPTAGLPGGGSGPAALGAAIDCTVPFKLERRDPRQRKGFVIVARAGGQAAPIPAVWRIC